MNDPLVSVIIAVHDGEQTLAAAIESLLGQDYSPFEVIVVDDGSVDGTPEIVQSFERVRYLRQENAGAAAARNTALSLANGTFVANFDSDDLLPPTRLSVQANHLVEHPEVGCVFGRQEWLNAPPWLARDKVYGDVDGIPLSSAMFRRDVLLELGGYDTSFVVGEDTDVLIRMRERGIEYAVLPEIVLYRRYHEGSLTTTRNAQEQLLRSLRAKLDRQREQRS